MSSRWVLRDGANSRPDGPPLRDAAPGRSLTLARRLAAGWSLSRSGVRPPRDEKAGRCRTRRARLRQRPGPPRREPNSSHVEQFVADAAVGALDEGVGTSRQLHLMTMAGASAGAGSMAVKCGRPEDDVLGRTGIADGGYSMARRRACGSALKFLRRVQPGGPLSTLERHRRSHLGCPQRLFHLRQPPALIRQACLVGLQGPRWPRDSVSL